MHFSIVSSFVVHYTRSREPFEVKHKGDFEVKITFINIFLLKLKCSGPEEN